MEHGEVQVSRKVVGYKKIKFYTCENVGYGDVTLPEKDMHTTSYWFTIPWDLLDRLELSREEIIDGLSGLPTACTTSRHAASCRTSATSTAASATRAASGSCATARTAGSSRIPTRRAHEVMENAYDPTVFIFDAYPGGIGLFREPVREARRADPRPQARSSTCPCEHGCPMCVGPTLEVGPSAKDSALGILDLMVSS